ncbi:MAG TPA: Uma2 family endonuclease [Geminicoccaceae bacterium]|nr:Uma2 family endonuclease [Geminicoccaceae bacterium]
MASQAPQRMTLAAFLKWDGGTDRRYQLVDGVLMMMAPATEAHGELAAALTIQIGTRLKPPCRVISEAGMTVPDRNDTYYVADRAVTCVPREPGRRMVAEPVLIVEVLSPSTEHIDRLRKLADYRTLLSVQEILIVFPGERRVEVQRRTADGWRVEDLIGQASITLGVCDGAIPLEAIYRDLLAAPEAPSGL